MSEPRLILYTLLYAGMPEWPERPRFRPVRDRAGTVLDGRSPNDADDAGRGPVVTVNRAGAALPAAGSVRDGDFVEAMAAVPTAVSVVTARDEHGRPCGMTVGSFGSLSLDPPLILVCVASAANCAPAFDRCGSFAVSVLRPGQEAVARRFASRGVDKFDADDLEWTPSGLPTVRDALVVVECRTRDRHPAGDHVIMIGEVVHAAPRDGTAMIYHRRRYTAVTA